MVNPLMIWNELFLIVLIFDVISGCVDAFLVGFSMELEMLCGNFFLLSLRQASPTLK